MPSMIPSGFSTEQPVSAVPLKFFSEVAARFNLARGLDGFRFEIGPDGGLIGRLGSDEYQYRTITTCEPTIIDGVLTALVFKKVRCFCALPDGDPVVSQITAASGWSAKPIFTDGVLTAIEFRETPASDLAISVPVHPCDTPET